MARVVSEFKRTGKVDFVVANAENAAAGKGLTGGLAEELFAAGADVLTLGDHTWDQKELQTAIEREPRIVRPANFAPGCPGRGWVTVTAGDSTTRITVINLVGRTFMNNYDCPFRTADAILKRETDLAKIILVDIHAEATSEKIVMGRYLDGRVSCVAGTHTHVQTSDETVHAGGTAYITDLGMTGAKDSALGRDLDSVTAMMVTGMPRRFHVARDDVVLEGAIIQVNGATGRARGIKRVRERLDGEGA